MKNKKKSEKIEKNWKKFENEIEKKKLINK